MPCTPLVVLMRWFDFGCDKFKGESRSTNVRVGVEPLAKDSEGLAGLRADGFARGGPAPIACAPGSTHSSGLRQTSPAN